MNMLNYKGYTLRVKYTTEDDIFWGVVVGLGSSISILCEGETVYDLIEDFHVAIDVYLTECEENGTEPVKPFSELDSITLSPQLQEISDFLPCCTGDNLKGWFETIGKQLLETNIQYI